MFTVQNKIFFGKYSHILSLMPATFSKKAVISAVASARRLQGVFLTSFTMTAEDITILSPCSVWQ